MSIRPVHSRRDLRAFLDLPYRLHAADPVWVPPLRREVKALLKRKGNPFFEYGEMACFLAERKGETVGRIAAVENRLHNEIHGDRTGFFGFFECVDDRSIAGELVEAAAGWVRERGLEILRGPASPSLNHECGLLVEGFETPPCFMMPHNPPYYAALLEDNGFRKSKDLLAFEGGSMEGYVEPPERARRAAEVILRRAGLTIRPLDLKRILREVGRIRPVYNACWESNWGFVPITESEATHMARAFRPVVVPEAVPMIEKDGRLVAFALPVPDLNQVLRRNRSGRLLPGILKILWALKRERIRRARIMLLGVLPEYRGKGIDAILWHWVWSRAGKHNMTWGEASWILEDNAAMANAAERMGFRRYKTYRLYDRAP